MVTAVRRFEEATARAAAVHSPRLAADLPKGRVEHARIRRVHRDVYRACHVAPLQHLCPRRAVVDRFEDATAHAAEVIRGRLRRHSRYGDGTPAAERADEAEAKAAEKVALLRDEQQWKRKSGRERDRETESFHKLQHRTR